MHQSPKPQQKSATIVFLHIPKAAGTTLKDILYRQYSTDEIYELDAKQFIQSQENFKQLDSTKKAKITILMGHMYFGLHEFINSPAAYITMLRNPIERVISYYHFVKKLPSHEDYELIKTNNISIQEYCQMGRQNMCNGQTRFLSGTSESETCNYDTLAVAKQNLQHNFAVVGIQERFDESLLLLHQKLGWNKMPFYYRRNTNRSNSYSRLEISADALSIIRKHNELDLELYEYANHLFERDLEQDPQNLKLFQLTNYIYGRYYTLAQKLLSSSISAK
ncbi:MAG: sulfotransferase family 2 domain-containing protein [Cyanobacteria bacterium P01_C01_bin.72]